MESFVETLDALHEILPAAWSSRFLEQLVTPLARFQVHGKYMRNVSGTGGANRWRPFALFFAAIAMQQSGFGRI